MKSYESINNKLSYIENKIVSTSSRIDKQDSIKSGNKIRLKKMEPISLNISRISEWRSDWVWPTMIYEDIYETDIIFYYQWILNIGKIRAEHIPAVKASVISKGINDYDTLWNLNLHGVFFSIHKIFKMDNNENVTLLAGISHKSWEGVKPVQFSLYVSYKNEKEYY